MRTRIWEELSRAKFNNEFTILYANQQRQILRYFNMGILVFSTSGILGWKCWEDYPLFVLILISSISLLRLVQPHLIMNDKQISNLELISKFYIDYNNKLEKIWYDLEYQRNTDIEISDLFFQIRATESTINTIVNETIWSKPKQLVKIATKRTDEYLNRVFNI